MINFKNFFSSLDGSAYPLITVLEIAGKFNKEAYAEANISECADWLALGGTFKYGPTI